MSRGMNDKERIRRMLKERHYSDKAISEILKWYCDDETEKVKVSQNQV